jgi:hypothetical protein
VFEMCDVCYSNLSILQCINFANANSYQWALIYTFLYLNTHNNYDQLV